MSLRDQLKTTINEVIIFLKGENVKRQDMLFSDEELEELGYTVKSQLSKYRDRDEE